MLPCKPVMTTGVDLPWKWCVNTGYTPAVDITKVLSAQIISCPCVCHLSLPPVTCNLSLATCHLLAICHCHILSPVTAQTVLQQLDGSALLAHLGHIHYVGVAIKVISYCSSSAMVPCKAVNWCCCPHRVQPGNHPKPLRSLT
jgi:hypothetical protein